MQIKELKTKTKTFYSLIVDDCELIFTSVDEIKTFLSNLNYNKNEIINLVNGLY